MRKILILILVVVLIAAAGFLFLLNKQAPATYSAGPSGKIFKMVLGENGYEPQNITIKKGDIIEFSTSLEKPSWPASDIHPTHGIYSEFDPQDAIMPGKTWKFKFDKLGTWRYHDHLAPYFTGKITVQ